MSKQQKYDRQLRLWHEHGQALLESSKICLLNAEAVGTETLKNLVLPAVGSVTVVDGATVTSADVSKNFFLDPSFVGENRARSVVTLLRELNPDVEIHSCDESCESMIENNIDFFGEFSVVVAANLDGELVLRLSDFLWHRQIPFFVVRSFGFLGYLRIVLPELAVVETHPDHNVDLRLDCPFPSLVDYAKQFDFSAMPSAQKSHVPFVVILLACLAEWSKTVLSTDYLITQHNSLPKTYEDKKQFKALIASLKGDLIDAENFDEAMAFAYRAWTPTCIPQETLDILQDDSTNVTSNSTSFWILARALKEFVDTHDGKLPLGGSLPDMKSDSESYIKLQQIYRKKALEDQKWIYETSQRLIQDLGLKSDTVTQEEVQRFCKNAAHLKLVRYTSYRNEVENQQSNSSKIEIARKLEELDTCCIYYVLFRAVDQFYTSCKRYPGIHNEDLESDFILLKKCVSAVLSGLGLSSSSIPDEFVTEMVRFGACELHNVSSLMGGICAQEIIKVLTKQYVPLDNTLVYNGIQCVTGTFRM